MHIAYINLFIVVGVAVAGIATVVCMMDNFLLLLLLLAVAALADVDEVPGPLSAHLLCVFFAFPV